MMGIDIIGIENPVMDFNILTTKCRKPEDSRGCRNTAGRARQCRQRASGGSQTGRQLRHSGIVGDDPYGQFCIDDFKRHNIDVSHLLQDKGNATSSAFAWQKRIPWPEALLPKAAHAGSRTMRNWIKSISAPLNTCIWDRSDRHR